MDAKARAQARRQAILSKGSNRLQKLTSSARGEEGASLYDDPPLPSFNSAPVSRASSIAPPDMGLQHAHDDTYGGLSGPDADAERQQQQFIQAMMGGSGGGSGLGGGFGPDTAGMQDPMAAFMAALGGPGGPGGDFPGASPFPANANQTSPFSSPFAPRAAPKPKTRFERFLPLLHIISTLFMIAFFVLRLDNHSIPGIIIPRPNKNGLVGASPGKWEKWAELEQHRGADWVFHAIPLFWAFTTMQVALHSIHLFFDTQQPSPPALLGMVIPLLPPRFSALITVGLKYLQIGGMLLDDFAILLFGLGIVVWAAGWAVQFDHLGIT